MEDLLDPDPHVIKKKFIGNHVCFTKLIESKYQYLILFDYRYSLFLNKSISINIFERKQVTCAT